MKKLFLVKFTKIFILTLLSHSALIIACSEALTLPSQLPREINAQQTFDQLVDWIHDELIIKQKAPGFVVGVSGTDSILVFLASAKAFERAGRADRVVGIHYGRDLSKTTSTDEAGDHDWFQNEVIPWLRSKVPGAKLIVDSSFDYTRDGMRWGALLDWSVLNPKTGRMRPASERYWVVGTRNRTEDTLMNYSNVSTAASVQPITHIWKSEVLKICEFLGVPREAISRSCQADCVCGREDIQGFNIPETDAILMAMMGELSEEYLTKIMPFQTLLDLKEYIAGHLRFNEFKKLIPYVSSHGPSIQKDSVELSFENLILQISQEKANLKELQKIIFNILRNSSANMAAALVSELSRAKSLWLPEMLTLFNTAKLRLNQKQRMLEAVFGVDQNIPIFEVQKLILANARIAHYGFSFPKWRFLTARYNNSPSLLETFGMQKIMRTNDIRDAILEASNPERDELGSGFIWQNQELYIEYRRSYILCSYKASSSKATTVVIRNNSSYFGRDRLRDSAYISWENLSIEELQSIGADKLMDTSKFITWENFTSDRRDIEIAEKTQRLTALLDHLDAFNMKFNNWLESPQAFPYLINFLKYKLANSNSTKIFLGLIPYHSPPWNLQEAKELSAELLSGIESAGSFNSLWPNRNTNLQIVLSSSESGDYP